MKRLVWLCPLVLLGCGSDDPGYTQEELTSFRAALPRATQFQFSVPEATVSSARFLGDDPANSPVQANEIAGGINGLITGVIDLLKVISDTPPSFYDGTSKEFVWGPHENEDGFGTWAAYIRDAGEDADFRYHYALLRGADSDVDAMVPIVWGGATPDENNEDHGFGIVVWDFEANNDFEENNDPDYDAMAAKTTGRFASVFGAGPSDDDPNAEFALAVAAFHDFVPQDKPNDPPVTAEYFGGNYSATGKGAFSVQFLHLSFSADVFTPQMLGASLEEQLDMRMAFLNEGQGRAEATVSGGDLKGPVTAAECWDDALLRTYSSFDGFETGNEASCGPFQPGLEALDLPDLDSIDQDILMFLRNLAATGTPDDA